MKKLALLIIVCTLAMGVNAQRKVIIDSIDVSQITGTDTTIYFAYSKKMFGPAWSVEISYGTLNADDATISFGLSNQKTLGASFNTLSLSGAGSFPYTLDVTTNDYVNSLSDTVATDFWQMDNMLGWWLACKLAKGSVTSGKVYIYFMQN